LDLIRCDPSHRQLLEYWGLISSISLPEKMQVIPCQSHGTGVKGSCSSNGTEVRLTPPGLEHKLFTSHRARGAYRLRH
jgi:hypothetical protein